MLLLQVRVLAQPLARLLLNDWLWCRLNDWLNDWLNDFFNHWLNTGAAQDSAFNSSVVVQAST
jgi:hypothetical protein